MGDFSLDLPRTEEIKKEELSRAFMRAVHTALWKPAGVTWEFWEMKRS